MADAKLRHVTATDDPSIPIVLDQVRSASRGIARDHRKAARHGFIHDQPPRIRVRRENKHVSQCIVAGQLFALDEARRIEPVPAQSGWLGESVRRGQFPLPPERDRSRRAAQESVCHRPQAGQRLLFPGPACPRTEKSAAAIAASDADPVVLTDGRRLSGEEFRVHRVGCGKDFFVARAIVLHVLER